MPSPLLDQPSDRLGLVGDLPRQGIELALECIGIGVGVGVIEQVQDAQIVAGQVVERGAALGHGHEGTTGVDSRGAHGWRAFQLSKSSPGRSSMVRPNGHRPWVSHWILMSRR
jgi:hypothetical protein